MTIKRQYTLPYCNLVLEGLSANANDPFSPLTILMNAECRLPGVTDITLTGGREFLDSLVAAVSGYGQELLSGVTRPAQTPGTPAPIVALKPGDHHNHHLIVRQHPIGEPALDTTALPPLDIPLTTVQFFDLMETVDQLLADTQTLPDLTAQFQAVSRRLVKPAEPMTKRAAPAVLGAAALAAAGLALFFVPPPQFEPAPPGRQTDTPAETSSAVSNPDSPTAPPTGAEAGLSNPEQLAAAPVIVDPEKMAVLQDQLTRRLETAWQLDSPPSGDLAYRVVVAEDGDLLGYKYANDRALAEVDRTPLPALTLGPEPAAPPGQDPVAQFLVTFTPTGQVLASPWREPSPDSEPRAANPLPPLAVKITDPDQLRQLNRTLYDRIAAQLSPRSAPAALTYRVRLTADGDIIGYEPVNAAAGSLAQETPLPGLVSAAASQTPSDTGQADFKVVFSETGVLEVSPWEGWPQ
ncbi:MAG TPA: DUF4335 domain-containing protein [Leptolyngbyaceae cyanobacterium M65_K2018_010]|nr:DUF4335 domain-containing protein [Leptolyngbyaceae cyanobacterium M65_K2018_010]